IRYTVNGAVPDEGVGALYTAPILLTQASDRTGIVVRARAFIPGLLPSETVTHTYLLRRPWQLTNNPSMFFSGDPGRSFYAPHGVMAVVPPKTGSIWLAANQSSYNNVLIRGFASEREAFLEMFFPEGYHQTPLPPVRRDVGMRISASGWQRPRMGLSQAATASPWPVRDTGEKPSFNVYFSGDYAYGDLAYPLFTNYSVSDFGHLRLRAGKNDNYNPYITDELVRRLFADMGHPSSRGMFCSVWVNAIYKGIYNVCERLREPFFQAHFNTRSQWDVSHIGAWVEGDGTAFQQLLTALDRDLTNPANWKAVTDRIDVNNAADYYLLNIYCAMWDWPGNNYVIYRERSSGPNGRFRFGVWDAEGGFNAVGYGKAVNFNTITNELIVPPSNGSYNQNLTRVFRRLAASPEFRLRFADRVNLLMFNGGVLDDRDPDLAG
ncbi:hypothetical protein EG829_24325, partial [bacterium]|nr:hypothetical protein [bacterium]